MEPEEENVLPTGGTVGPTRADMPADWQTPEQGAGNIIDQAQLAQQQQILAPTPDELARIQAYKSQLTPISGEPGAQGLQSIMPGITQDINVGATSGSLIGSGNIYVPTGAVYGWDVDLARKKALEESTAKRKQEEAAIGSKFEVRKPGQLKDQRFQGSVNQAADEVLSGFMTNIQEKYGDDYRYVMDHLQDFPEGREYIQKMDALDLLVGQADQVTDLLVEMQDSYDAGEKIYSDASMKILKEVQNMLGDFESGDVNALVGLRDKLMELEGGKNIDNYLKQQGTISMLKAEIRKRTNIGPDEDIPDFATLSTTQKKSYQKSIDDLTNLWSSPQGPFAKEISMGLIDKDMIKSYLDAYLKDEILNTKTLTSTKEGAGTIVKIEQLDKPTGAPIKKKFEGTGGDYNLEVTNEYAAPSDAGKVNVSGLQLLDPTAGSPITAKGAQEIELISLASTADSKFSKDGKPVPIAIVRYVEEETVEDEEGDMVTKNVTHEVPVLYNENLQEVFETNHKILKLEKGFATEARKKLGSGESQWNNTGGSSGEVKFNGQP